MAPTSWPFHRREVVAEGTTPLGDWHLVMPRGWKNRNSDSGTVYFESSDSTKGIHLTVWRSSEASSADALAQFERVKRTALLEMKGYEWSFPDERRDGSHHRWLLDAYAKARDHRMVTLVQIEFPMVLSATFHDYYCRSYSESYAYFEPIVASIRITKRAET